MRDREDKGLQNPRIAAQTVSLGLPFWEELAKGLDLRLTELLGRLWQRKESLLPLRLPSGGVPHVHPGFSVLFHSSFHKCCVQCWAVSGGINLRHTSRGISQLMILARNSQRYMHHLCCAARITTMGGEKTNLDIPRDE
jgi:hypothetical protein